MMFHSDDRVDSTSDAALCPDPLTSKVELNLSLTEANRPQASQDMEAWSAQGTPTDSLESKISSVIL